MSLTIIGASSQRPVQTNVANTWTADQTFNVIKAQHCDAATSAGVHIGKSSAVNNHPSTAPLHRRHGHPWLAKVELQLVRCRRVPASGHHRHALPH